MCNFILTSQFRTNSYRGLKRFVGEATAYAAGSYIAICEIEASHRAISSPDPWRTIGEKHSVNIKGLKADSLLRSTVRLSIVGVYSAFDSYVDSLKRELKLLKGKSWVQHDGDSVVDGVRKNLFETGDQAANGIDSHLACLDYYRLVRNAVAHRSERGDEHALNFFNSHQEELAEFRSAFRLAEAPNSPSMLTYHDIKALARCALWIAEAVDEQLDPGNKRLAELIPVQRLRLHNNKLRTNNAIKAWLQNVYGVSMERASEILKVACYTQGGL